MAAPRFALPYAQPADANGRPLAGAKLYFYASGTSTPLDTYSDAARTTTNANPVVADSAGRFPSIFLGTEAYKVVLKTAANITIRTDDPVSTTANLADLIFTPAWTGAVSRTAQDKLSDRVSVKDFGATGDGTTDDTASIQAAFTWAISRGAEVHFPAGTYRVTSQVTVDGSAATGEDANRVDVVGDGAGCTVIKTEVTTGPTLYFRGSENTSNGAYHSFQRLANIRIEGTDPSRNSIAVRGDNMPYFAAENVVILYTEEGFRFTDVLSSIFSNCIVRGCIRGFSANRNVTAADDFESDPNNIGFYNCTFSSVAEYGLYFNGGANINFFGGSIENIGRADQWPASRGDQPAARWGLKIDSAGREGGTGVCMYGTYMEDNSGQADVWIDQADTAYSSGVSYSFTGVNFHRVSSTYYTTNNIRIDYQSTPVSLAINGCGFRHAGSYTPWSGRPCIQLPTTGRGWKASQSGNFFSSAADSPLWTETPSFTALLENDQNISNDSSTLVSFVKTNGSGGLIGEDYGNCWDDATHAFIAPYNVRMHFDAKIHWSGSLADGNFIRLELRVNNNVVKATSMNATGAQGLPLSCDINLLQNDVVQLVAYVNSGGASRTIFSGPAWTYFTGRPA